jgi:rfaE bifunctional protein nucleotidyltransferase chain/domain
MRRRGSLGKILQAPRAAARVRLQQKRGRAVVFTNGCFDLLHAGHVALLDAARGQGDFLVVGVNTDRSVRRLKGAGRPIVPLRERMEILAALRSVDCVVPFAEPTPARLVARLRPDVLVKGSDYRLPEIVGRDVVLAGGGRVVTVPLRRGRSTTGLIRRVLRAAR